MCMATLCCLVSCSCWAVSIVSDSATEANATHMLLPSSFDTAALLHIGAGLLPEWQFGCTSAARFCYALKCKEPHH
jgi:hypothetical protein